MAKTALERLRQPREPRIVDRLPEGALHWGPAGATMVISAPQEIEAYVRKIPKGKLATVNGLRSAIALRHCTTITCPVTTGVFLHIVARAAVEQERMGETGTTPWWRVLKSDGTLNDRFPGGADEHSARLMQDGFEIVSNGKTRRRVRDFETYLVKLS